MSTCHLTIDPTEGPAQASRSDLITAFRRVVSLSGRRQVTDLHVRRLLNFVQAKDCDGTGVQRSLEQLANKLFLSVSTCRNIIQRAVKHFGLLIVTEQRHIPGGQTVNRYSINWPHVSDLKSRARSKRPSSSPGSTDLLKSRARSKRLSESPVTNAICPSGPDREPSGDTRIEPLRPSATSAVKSQTTSSSPVTPSDSPVVPRPKRTARSKRLSHRIIRPSCYDPYFKKSPLPIAQPRGTPPEMLAHFEPVLTKLQTAIDIAKRLGATRIHDHLMRLLSKLKSVRNRASHPALCRTYLPPLKPPPEPTWQLTPVDWSKRTPTAVDWSKLAPTPTDWSQWNFNTPVPMDQASATPDQPSDQLAPLRSSASSAVESNSVMPPDSVPAELESLLATLDSLITNVDLALQSARGMLGITWLQKHFTSMRRSLKTIRAKAQSFAPIASAANQRFASANIQLGPSMPFVQRLPVGRNQPQRSSGDSFPSKNDGLQQL